MARGAAGVVAGAMVVAIQAMARMMDAMAGMVAIRLV
jgi:hypothetical protein